MYDARRSMYYVGMDRAVGVTGEKAGWIAKRIYRAITKRIGRVPKSKTLAAHHTPTLVATTWMDAVCGSARTIHRSLKELVQVKVATMVGCPF
jgi:hypothetical protein